LHRARGGGNVLDVGCGRGHFLKYLQDHGWRVAGIELSELAARHARDVLHVDVHVGDFLTIPGTPNSWDVVVLWHVLEHMPDVRAAIRHGHELLRREGLLLIAVPNFSSLQAQVAGRHWFHLDIPRHYVHFTSRGLVQLLREAGFEIQRMDHFSLEQNVYGWLQSLYNMLGFKDNLLYNLMKNRSARDSDVAQRLPWVQIIGLLLLLPFLLPASVLLSLLEALLRRGGTVEVYARKLGS
jgi:SAM-dependent methyltransferase